MKTSSSLLSRVHNIIKIVNSRLASDLTHFYSRSSKLNTLFLLLQNLFYYFFFDKNNKRVQATWGSHARLKILLKKLSKWRRLVDCSCRWFRSVETSSFGENSPHAGSKSGKSSFAKIERKIPWWCCCLISFHSHTALCSSSAQTKFSCLMKIYDQMLNRPINFFFLPLLGKFSQERVALRVYEFSWLCALACAR